MSNLKQDGAKEFLTHGFGRRLKTLKKCIENVYALCPPDTSNLLPRDILVDLSINLQAFILNVFGCFDNLSWVLVKEKDINIDRNKVGFLRDKIDKEIRLNLSDDLRKYFLSDSHIRWKNYLKDFRDALAHRIPLYVPPKGLNPQSRDEYDQFEKNKSEALKKGDFEKYETLDMEQEKIGAPLFVMQHSFLERNSMPMVFHVQIIIDFKTVCEFANNFMESFW